MTLPNIHLSGERIMYKLYAEKITKRDKIQIFADIINVCIKSSTVTRIIRLANVPYNRWIEFSEILCDRGYLEKISTDKKLKDDRTKFFYKATPSGIRWYKLIHSIYKPLELDNIYNGVGDKHR
jgi:predicted transcriptional regulator